MSANADASSTVGTIAKAIKVIAAGSMSDALNAIANIFTELGKSTSQGIAVTEDQYFPYVAEGVFYMCYTATRLWTL